MQLEQTNWMLVLIRAWKPCYALLPPSTPCNYAHIQMFQTKARINSRIKRDRVVKPIYDHPFSLHMATPHEALEGLALDHEATEHICSAPVYEATWLPDTVLH